MPLLLALILMGVVMSLPAILYTRRLKGKDENTMGLGMGDIKFGQNLGEKHWQKLNEQPDNATHR